jgi:hypothetical protein
MATSLNTGRHATLFGVANRVGLGFAAKALLAVSTTKESTVIDAKKRYMMRLPSINLSKKWIYLNFTLLRVPARAAPDVRPVALGRYARLAK